MRPLRLEVEGFSCYREKQEPLDLSGFSLFAIAGPTGAGKSSVLDAMLLALYGVVPRMGKQGVAEFISHGRDVLAVSLDFSVRGRLYRVARRIKRRKGGGQVTIATLAEMTSSGERSIADNVKRVDEATRDVLGLDYETFTRTVILPQNKFAEFLHSEPRKQREILQHLLCHEVYERMRAEAERRRMATAARLDSMERQLGQLSHATPGAVAAKSEEILVARQSLDSLTEKRAQLGVDLRDLRDRRRLTEDLRTAQANLVALESKSVVISAKQAELSVASRAETVKPLVEFAERANGMQIDAEKALRASDAEVLRLTNEHDEAAAAASVAARAAEQCQELRTQISRLDELKGYLQRRPTVLEEAKTLRGQLARAERDIPVRRAALEKIERAHREADGALVSARNDLSALAYDPERHRSLQDLAEQAAQIRTLETEVVSLGAEVEESQSRIQEAEQHLADATAAKAEATSVHADVEARKAAAERDLESGRQQDAAAALRMHLHAGDSCPVCLQTVSEVPSVGTPLALTALEAAVKTARQHEQAARRQLEELSGACAAAEASLKGGVTAHDDLVRKLGEKRDASVSLRREIDTQMAAIERGATVGDTVAWLGAELQRLKVLQSKVSTCEAHLREASDAERRTKLETVETENRLREVEGERDRNTAALSDKDRELSEIAQRIREVTSEADPSAERQTLAARVSKLEQERTRTENALTGSKNALAAARATRDASSGALEKATANAQRAGAELTEALSGGGFASVSEAMSAARTEEQRNQLDVSVREHERSLAAVTQRLMELEKQIGDRQVEAEELSRSESDYVACEQAFQNAGQQMSRLESELDRLARDAEQRSALVAEFEMLRDQFSIVAELATDLKGDRFQEYLLEEAFRSLVLGASVRMHEISRRYTLDWSDGDFYVVDHDNAGERRRAETLSGGETFMASLSLALQLSDEVLRTSGSLEMDSLFIDEGFGTLDTNSLAEVTDAIEALRQDGGRMIGVISHRTELTDRLPGCIRVDKGAGESRWVVERVG